VRLDPVGEPYRFTGHPGGSVTVGTPFHPRTALRNTRQAWREWSGYLSAIAYHDSHDIEYAALRNAAVVFDVSPLYKYRLRGKDAARLVDRIITRDVRRLVPGRVIYTPWCDEDGKVLDDGTIQCWGPEDFRWTAADPQLRWFTLNAHGLDVEIVDESEAVATLALQGPLSRAVLEAAAETSLEDLGYYRCRRLEVAGIPLEVSRTGYTGDLGYELWVAATHAPALWDAVMAAGAPFQLRPAGLAALDLARLEAGLILIEVDYTSARFALAPHQRYSPFEIGLGRLVDLDKGPFVGQRALLAERARGGPPRRLVGLEFDWGAIEAAYAARDLPPTMAPTVDRTPIAVYRPGGSQVGRATSHGWSPLLKRVVGLATVAAPFAAPGTRLEVEWSVAGYANRVGATVVPLPFLNLPRRRQ
jgi:aminomethyltransferase